MQTYPRCPDCPIAGPCVYQWTGHQPYCEWAARGGDLVRRVEEMSAAGPPDLAALVPPEPDHPSSVAEPPSIAQQLVGAAGAAVRFVAGGLKLVDNDELARRQAICDACPRWNRAARRCKLCRCFTDMKLRLPAERCPDDPPRW